MQAVWWLARPKKKHMNTQTPSCLWAKKTLFYKEASINYDKNFYIPIMILVKFTNGADRLKHDMTFLHEIIEYNITNEEPGRFKKKVMKIRIIGKICYPLI